MVQQQVRGDDHAVFDGPVFLEQGAQGIALRVGEMLLPEQGVAEGEARGDRVLPRQRSRVFRPFVAEAHAAAAPEAIGRRAVDGADFAPVVKVFPAAAEQRQKSPVQFVEFKQPGEMIIRLRFMSCHTSCSGSRLIADGPWNYTISSPFFHHHSQNVNTLYRKRPYVLLLSRSLSSQSAALH